MSVDGSIRIIEEYTKRYPEDNVFVNFSGGKYSLVLLHLTLRVLKEIEAVYVDTTITLPECDEYARELCDEWGVVLSIIKRRDTDFWRLVKRRGFPTRRLRWCMREFKFVPLRLFNISMRGECLHLTGTSKYESTMRKRVYDVRGFYHYNYVIGSHVLHPLLEWSYSMIMEYIKKHGLSVNPCYNIYKSGGNCYYCPYVISPLYYLTLYEEQPKLYQKIVEAEKALKKGGAALYLGRGKILHLGDPSALKDYMDFIYSSREAFCPRMGCKRFCRHM